MYQCINTFFTPLLCLCCITVHNLCSHPPFKVTPANYEPPGFKEGVCDRVWFEGMAVHFRVGEVQTPFHTLKVRVAAEQGRVEKLQEGNYLRESRQVSLDAPSTLPELRGTQVCVPQS